MSRTAAMRAEATEATAPIAAVPMETAVVRERVEAEGVVRLDVSGLTAEDFAAFMATLGEPMFTRGETPHETLSDLNVVTNVGRRTKPKSVFHSDTTYVARPPSYSGLYAAEVPEEGGATLFIDQYRAYDTLPARMRAALDGATMLHSVTGVELGPDDEREARHPVVRRHPGTGRRALYLTTPARCSALHLADGEDRSDLIAALYDHSLDTEPRRRHWWSVGDVLVWDNRCTLHAADHSGVVGNRTLYRALTLGEVPTP